MKIETSYELLVTLDEKMLVALVAPTPLPALFDCSAVIFHITIVVIPISNERAVSLLSVDALSQNLQKPTDRLFIENRSNVMMQKESCKVYYLVN